MKNIRNFIEKTYYIIHGIYTVFFRSIAWAIALIVIFPLDSLKISKDTQLIVSLLFVFYLCIMDKLERNRTKTMIDVSPRILGKDLDLNRYKRSR